MKEVLVTKNITPKPGFKVGVILNKAGVKGEVGIEIEVEGKKLPQGPEVPTPWGYHVDGSLRGEENGEYVLNRPIPFKDVSKTLKKLWEAFNKKKTIFDDSNRTSVHVHLNFQEFHLNRLAAFLGIYFAVEEILTEWCGEHRVGNLFCLRAIDAPGIVQWVKTFIKNDGTSNLPETLHYSGLNVSALKKFGSIEVRMLRGCSDPVVIEKWIKILEMIYKKSENFSDPREVCTLVSSSGGALAFFDIIFEDLASVIREGIGFTEQEIRDSIYNGIRLAQDICYCRDWELYRPMELKDDPWGRTRKTVTKKILNTPSLSILNSPPVNPSLPPFNTLEAILEEEYEPEEEYDDSHDIPV